MLFLAMLKLHLNIQPCLHWAYLMADVSADAALHGVKMHSLYRYTNCSTDTGIPDRMDTQFHSYY